MINRNQELRSRPGLLLWIVSLTVLSLLANVALAADEFNVDAQGVLMHGYDPVSYFDGDPAPGRSGISSTYNGINLRFASEANRERFHSKPDKYLPQYGGYCSYGVRMGKKFDVTPTAWRIEDGKLYLLLDRATQVTWERDLQQNIGIADRIWTSIRTVSVSSLDGE